MLPTNHSGFTFTINNFRLPMTLLPYIYILYIAGLYTSHYKTTWTNLRFRKAKVEETPENYIPADSSCFIDFEFGSELLK